MPPVSSAIDLPFTAKECKFFAAVVVVNLALDAALLGLEHWLLVAVPRSTALQERVEGLALACLFAQIGVLAVWAALFAGSHLLRILIATLCLCLSYYLLRWFAEELTPSVIDFRRWAEIRGLPMIIAIFFAAQFPFWMLRFFRGWRISTIAGPPPRSTEAHRFTVLHMLGWAAFLGFPMSMARLYHGLDTTSALLIMACLLLVMWIFGALCLWASLGARRLVSGILIAIPGGFATIMLATYLFMWLSWRGPPRRASIFLVFLHVLAGVAIVGMGTGIAARLFGYRLRNRAEALAALEDAGPQLNRQR